ncbi:cation:proton antiporter [Rubrobacter indicoceani]|uniref:cation:proton antiporter n=1 Tax=Rubrobacter indicoceani TaxID=2051957 RepID=UPI000E5B93CA|nr:monovalent cation/H(+) antiporter subunit G [Rubrobacter indicoceani]
MLILASDILVLVGLLALTVGVYGIIKMPDVYLKTQAASKAVLLGTLPILASAALSGDPATAARAVMIAILLLLTTPIAAHAITKAVAAREDENA